MHEIMQTLKEYWLLLGIGTMAFGIAWWAHMTREMLFRKMDKIGSNDLPHIQHATETTAEKMNALCTAAAVSAEQHSEQTRLLASIDATLRGK